MQVWVVQHICGQAHICWFTFETTAVPTMDRKPTKFEYKVKAGDNLSSLIQRFYTTQTGSQSYHLLIASIIKNNPHINNPDLIKTGDILVFPAVASRLDGQSSQATITANHQSVSRGTLNLCTPDNPFGRPTPYVPRITSHFNTSNDAIDLYRPPFANQNVEEDERELFWALSWMTDNYNEITMPANIFAGSVSNLLNPQNRSLIESVSDSYAAYKSGALSKGQYDYSRKKALETLSKRLGPTEKWLFNGKTTKESIRIARGGGIPATQNIKANAARLAGLAKKAKYGGVVLTGVGLAASCYQVANTASEDEKNEIIVESLASTAIGGMIGVGVGIFLVSNPIGWGTAIVLATGTALASYGAGKLAKEAYDYSGRPVNFHTGMGIDRICN